MRLNLGCGDRYVDGWVNVDHGCPHRLDERVDLTGPLPAHWQGQVSHVYAGHLFEHLTRGQCVDLARRLLDASDPRGCSLVVVSPDVKVADLMVDAGTFDWSWGSPDEIRYGAGRWAGDVHLWYTTGAKLAAVLVEAGWPIVRDLGGIAYLEGGWPVADPGPRWQAAVKAHNGGGTR